MKIQSKDSQNLRARFPEWARLPSSFCITLITLRALAATVPAVEIFNADFESTTGDNAVGTLASEWRVNPSATDTATTGAWERADPTGTTYQVATTPSGDFCFVTDGSNTSDFDLDIDGGVTSVRSPEITIPANAVSAELDLQYYLSHSAATGGDFFRITAQAATTDVLFQIQRPNGTAVSEGFAPLVLDLTPYIGQTVTFLIEAADAGGGNLVEAGFDDVRVTVALPGISGQVRYDIDGDGDLAATQTEDRPLSGVTVELFADDGNGGPTGAALDVVLTDEDGVFRFQDLANGNYVVVASDLADGTSTGESDGTADGVIAVAFSGTQVSDLVFLDTTDAPGLVTTAATYYFPYEESDILAALDTINSAANEPIESFNSISIAYDGTIILYDHWEDNGPDGYEAFPAEPTQPHTQVWGDGNLLNGVAPGSTDDLLNSGDIIPLVDEVTALTSGNEILFDARDKISASKYVSITRASWADGSETLLAGAWELYPSILWGTSHTLPIGENIPDAVDAQIFEFVGASILSGSDGNEIRLNGDLVAILDEGETFAWNGGRQVGDVLTSTRPTQVHLITGDVASNYESRWYTLPPDSQFSNAYVAPTSTPDGNATLVWLYNPAATAIDVTVEVPGQTNQVLSIPASDLISFELTNGEAARFNTASGEVFFALATVDSDNAATNLNQTNDWGYSLVPERFLTQLAVAGLAPGDDPTFFGTPENSAPLWVTPVFPRNSPEFVANRDADPNNDVPITICVDYNGNGNVDGLATGGTDPDSGFEYDRQFTLDEMEQLVLYVDTNGDGIPDPGGDQTGTKIWVCDGSSGLLAVAYGQDPNTASVGTPAVDLGTTVPGVPVLSLAKDAQLTNDVNANGFPDVGDTLRYTIVVENSGIAPFNPNQITVLDDLNNFLTYTTGTTELTDENGTTIVADNGSGTPFPVDSDFQGFNYNTVLNAGGSFELAFEATVTSLPADGTGLTQNTARASDGTTEITSTEGVPFPTASISGSVFEDTDGDDLGDVTMDEVQITLLDGAGNPVDFNPATPAIEPYTVTTFNGAYEFPNLPPGDYIVQQSQPAGFVTVSDGDSTLGGDDASNTSLFDNQIPVNIVEGENDTGNDFVERAAGATTGSLSGTVLLDANNDDIGDSGISGVVLTLKDESGADIDSDPSTPAIEPTQTTTGTDGSYSFSGLTPGNYQVVQTQPSSLASVSDVDGVNNNVIGDENLIAVAGGADSGGNDFVEEFFGSLSGVVSVDTTGDDLGDIGLGGVVLTLKDSSGADIDSDPDTAGVQPTTTVTDSSGAYSFDNLPPGDYRVVETQPASYESVSDLDGGDLDVIGDQTLIAVVGNQNTPGNNFVEGGFGDISGTVLADTTGNGMGDTPISGVVLTLKDSSGDDIDSDPNTAGVQPTTTTTDGSGNYVFTGLTPDDYQVVQTQPSDFGSLSDVDGANNNIIGDETPLTVTVGQTNSGNDFLENLGAISGTVLADTTGDGMGDTPLSGVELTLKDSAGNDIDSDPTTTGVQPTTTTTDGSGNYVFTGLTPDDYQVVQTQPSDFGSLSDVDGANNNVIGDEMPVTVTAGATNSGNDFLENLGAISGTVLADTTGDGMGDTPLSGVELTLKDSAGNDIDSDPNTAGVQPTTTSTDGSGNYVFTGLTPDDYQVVQTQPSDFGSLSDVDGANNNVIGDEMPVTVTAGATNSGNDFLENLGAISGTVLADTTGDGMGDTPLSGVELTLKDSSGNDIDSDPNTTGVQPTTTLTDGSGNYVFNGLTPDDYQVVQTQPSDFGSLSDVDGANNNVIGDEMPVTVTPGATNSGNDFLENLGAISGTVLADTTGDGMGDTPLSGVELTLKDSAGNDIDSDPNTAGVQPTTTLTDGSGNYVFTGLTPDDYQVVQTQPSDFGSLSDVDGANNNVIGDEMPVTVTAGATNSGNDFLENLGAISGTVLADTTGDGMGDTPLSGVELTLKDSSGNDIDSDPNTAGVQPTTTTTDGSGNYVFTGLTPDDYQVVQTQPSDYGSLSDIDGANNNVIGDEMPVTVTAGATNSGNDFLENLGAISGTVLADTTGDGMGDTPLSGVELTLKDSAGNDIDSDPNTAGVQPTTTSTDGSGNYVFNGLTPEDYQVVQTQPSDFGSLSDVDGANNNVIGDEMPVTVTPGATNSGNDFLENLGVISGTVLADTTGDGMGDTPLSGVELTLKDSSGNDIDSDPTTTGVQPTTTTTDGSGNYTFNGLTPDDYQVVQTQPSDYGSLSDVDGANNNVIGDEMPVTVTAGATNSGNDFLENLGAINGTVLADTTGDGMGDTPLSGVELTLKDSAGNDIDSDPNTAGVQPTTTTTDGSGNYVFNGLTPEDYQVVQTQPSDYGSLSDIDGANNNIIGDEMPVTVTAGATNSGNDFLEFKTKAETYAEFQSDFAGELGSEAGPTDNPDGDIFDNILEYAFCLNPGSGVPGKGEFCLTKNPDGTINAQFFRRRGGLSDVTYTLEGADNLSQPLTWMPLTSVSEVVNTSDADVPIEAEKVIYENIQNATELTDATAAGVIRLKVEVDVDGSGAITSDEVSYSKIFGWQCLGYNDYQCATFSNPFSNKPVFSGTFAETGALSLATDTDGNVTLDVSDSALGEDLAALVGSSGSHYLQVTSGPLEGDRFDILSGGVDELTLVNDPGIFSDSDGVDSLNTRDGIPADNLFNGESYEVIRYHTIDDLFDPETTYAGEEDTDPNDATRLLFYNNRRDTPGFEILMLSGTDTTNSKWVFTNDLLFLNDQGGLRIDPSMGNWIHPKSSGDSQNPTAAPPVEQIAFGMVAEHDQAVALNEGYNLTGAMWPVDQSPAATAGRDLTVASGFDGGIDPNGSTELLFWYGDCFVDENMATYQEGYYNFMLLDGGGMQNWVDINDISLDNKDDILLESHRAVFLKILLGDEKEPHIYPQPF